MWFQLETITDFLHQPDDLIFARESFAKTNLLIDESHSVFCHSIEPVANHHLQELNHAGS